MVRVVLDESVLGQMAMDEGVNASGIVSLVHVLGRCDGAHPNHDASRAGKKLVEPHRRHRMSRRRDCTTKEILNNWSERCDGNYKQPGERPMARIIEIARSVGKHVAFFRYACCEVVE